MVKEYNLTKSVKGTITKNHLLQAQASNPANSTTLFDFELLDADTRFADEEKQRIKEDAIGHINSFTKEQFLIFPINNFTTSNGIAEYICHRVFKKDGKHLYNIMQLKSITYLRRTRNCVYDKFKCEEIDVKSAWTPPLDDYEI